MRGFVFCGLSSMCHKYSLKFAAAQANNLMRKSMKKLTQYTLSTLSILALSTAVSAQNTNSQAVKNSQNSAKNVILLISDGAGMETWNAASYYRHGALGHEVYDKFDVQLFSSTHPLNTSTKPTKNTENSVKFDSSKLWDNQKSDKIYKSKLSSYEIGRAHV